MKSIFTILFFLFCNSLLIAQSVPSSILVSNRNTNSIKEYDLSGQYLGDLVTSGSGGLSRPQEVFLLNDNLIVTGRDNTSLLKYNPYTGAFLGNFTSGYSLDNPTKTTIGPDGLIYVSQWGNVQNKVVRFDTTGAFVDEFTNIGVQTGMGQLWDSLGNMYVARWIDGSAGDVYKFDTAGIFQGVFISSILLNGPVNLWWADNGNIYVADWSDGAIKEFTPSGQLVGTPITGMTNVEGFDYDDQNRLYLCDWGGNQVRRYSSDLSSFEVLINGSGLSNPNDITITPAIVSSRNIDFKPIQIQVQPNPIIDKTVFSFQVPKNTSATLKIFDISGKYIETPFSQLFQSGAHQFIWRANHLLKGAYFYNLITDERTYSGKLIIE
jgi:streptogramin lyase